MSPEYTAVRIFEPVELNVISQEVAGRTATQLVPALSLIVTVPDGVPGPEADRLNSTLTACPMMDGFGRLDRIVRLVGMADSEVEVKDGVMEAVAEEVTVRVTVWVGVRVMVGVRVLVAEGVIVKVRVGMNTV